MGSDRPRSIFITCQGTRGDVQPYVNLGVALSSGGWSVLLGAPEEFRGFVTSHGLRFTDIGPAPTHTMYKSTVSDDQEGRAHRSMAGRPLAAYNAARRLFNPPDSPPFTLTWFRSILNVCREYQPDILMLVFTSWCGAAVIPELLGIPTKCVVSYPMPMAPTSEFAVAMAGTGFSLGWSFFNRLQWNVSQKAIVQRIHLPAAQRNLGIVIEEEAAAGRPLPGACQVALDKDLSVKNLPAIFAFSPALLPKPKDWPSHYHVIGQLQKLRSPEDAHTPLPSGLQEYLDRCRNRNLHVLYIGFGSLGFFSQERVTSILDTAASTVEMLSGRLPIRAIIQTTLSSTPGKSGVIKERRKDESQSFNAENLNLKDNIPPFFAFSETVDHTALFPQCSLVCSHGGVGTVQAALAAGKPVISVCCLPTADQSFWADICTRRKLGPQWLWVDSLTQQRFATTVVKAINLLETYTRNAEEVAREMAGENSIENAINLLEEVADSIPNSNTNTNTGPPVDHGIIGSDLIQSKHLKSPINLMATSAAAGY